MATIFVFLLYGLYIGTTWWIRLNRLCASAMRPYVKLLWPHVIISLRLSRPSISSFGTRASIAFFFSSISRSCCFFNSSAAFCIISCWNNNARQSRVIFTSLMNACQSSLSKYGVCLKTAGDQRRPQETPRYSPKTPPSPKKLVG